MRYTGHIAIILILLFAVIGCAVNPVTGEKEYMLYTESQELQLGENSDPDIRWQFEGVYHDARLSTYVDSVGQRVAAVSHRSNIPYHFTIVDSSIANAFALPGGYIYITRGLLVRLDNEAQLAAVLGHEIGHVAARHGMKRLTNIMTFNVVLAGADHLASGSERYRRWRGLVKASSMVLFATVSLGYSRDDEYQADELGTSYSSKAGYDPEGMVQLLEVLKSMHEREPSRFEEFFMSHPRSSDRVKSVRRQIDQLSADQREGMLKESEYKTKIRDLVVAQEAYDHYDKGKAHFEKGEYEEALAEYRKALQIRKNMAKPYHGIGLVYQSQGKHGQAIGAYKEALEIDPDYIFTYNDMGVTYISMGVYSNAISAFKQAVQKYENFDDAHANMGEAYYKQKKYTDAVQSLEMAIALNEKHPRAYTTLGLTYEANGNTTKAVESYEKAIEVAPKEDYTDVARQRLEQLKRTG